MASGQCNSRTGSNTCHAVSQDPSGASDKVDINGWELIGLLLLCYVKPHICCKIGIQYLNHLLILMLSALAY